MLETEMEPGPYTVSQTLEYWGSSKYQKQSRFRKMNQLWREIEKSQKFNPDDEMAAIKWTEFPATFTTDGNVSFDHVSDALPADRKKTVHTQGLVAKAKWVPVHSD